MTSSEKQKLKKQLESIKEKVEIDYGLGEIECWIYPKEKVDKIINSL